MVGSVAISKENFMPEAQRMVGEVISDVEGGKQAFGRRKGVQE